MDLALELGVPAEELARRMPQREFKAWGKYASQKLLPTRRMEFYMAQIALLIATTMGGAKDATLQDYLFDPEPPDDTEPDLEALKAAFDFRPVRKK